MRLRYRIVSLTVALGLLLASTAALAGKPAPDREALPGGSSIPGVLYGGPTSVTAACVLGETGTPAWLVNYLLPPDDAYYTLIRPSDCTGCPGGIVVLLRAHILLNFRVACTVPVSVRVVGAAGDAACRYPDTTLVRCQRLTYSLSPAAPGNYDFTLALPQDCCIDQDSFLEFNFLADGTACATSTTRPRLITTDVCNNCESYNIYPVVGGHMMDDLCANVGFPGNPIMNAEADCCLGTPAHPRTWGSLKTLYR